MKYLIHLKRQVKVWHFLISLGAMLIFITLILPMESANFSEASGGVSAPDSKLFYTSDDLFDIAEEIGEQGRRAYIISRLRFDIAWPVTYGAVLFTGLSLSLPSRKRYYWILYLPLLAVICDFFENTIVSIVFYNYPDQVMILSHLAGIFTFLKWNSLILGYVLLGVAFLYMIKEKAFSTK